MEHVTQAAQSKKEANILKLRAEYERNYPHTSQEEKEMYKIESERKLMQWMKKRGFLWLNYPHQK